jgi:hypothetical protein
MDAADAGQQHRRLGGQVKVVTACDECATCRYGRAVANPVQLLDVRHINGARRALSCGGRLTCLRCLLVAGAMQLQRWQETESLCSAGGKPQAWRPWHACKSLIWNSAAGAAMAPAAAAAAAAAQALLQAWQAAQRMQQHCQGQSGPMAVLLTSWELAMASRPCP